MYRVFHQILLANNLIKMHNSWRDVQNLWVRCFYTVIVSFENTGARVELINEKCALKNVQLYLFPVLQYVL